MFEYLLKTESSWEHIKLSSLPFALYGTGNGADKVIKELAAYDLRPEYIIASDSFVRDRSFYGIKVRSAADLEAEIGDYNILMCFASDRDEVISNVKNLMKRHCLLVPSVPVYGDHVFDKPFLKDNMDELEKAYSLLSDEKSKDIFKRIIEFQISGNPLLIFEAEESIDKLYEMLNLSGNENYLDLGAYRGDTVDEFIHYASVYASVTAIEPDKKNYAKLCEHCKNLRDFDALNAVVSDKNGTVDFSQNKGRGSSSGEGFESQSLSIDSLNKPFSYIKADIEGFESKMLKGAEESIKRYKPKMRIAVYHRSEDIFSLILQIHNIRDDYKFYLNHRKHTSFWDTDLICI